MLVNNVIKITVIKSINIKHHAINPKYMFYI